MKLLHSTFLAWATLAKSNAFTLLSTPPPSTTLQSTSTSSLAVVSSISNRCYSSSTKLSMVGIHEGLTPNAFDEEAMKAEEKFAEFMGELNEVKDYLGGLIEATAVKDVAAASGADVATEEATNESSSSNNNSDDIGLFGGGDYSPVLTSNAPPSSQTKKTRYNPTLRTTLGSTVLLSGTHDPKLLTVLNNNNFGQDSIDNFEFEKIVALVEDVGGAKKRVISREARYSGLLDKLSIEEIGGGLLPGKEKLEGVGSWIVRLDLGEVGSLLPQVAELAKGCEGLKNLVVMVEGVTDAATESVDGWDAVVAASESGDNFKCTLLAVGELYDEGKEGKLYHIGKVGSLSKALTAGAAPTMLRKEAYNIVGNLLALESTSNQALVAYEYSPEVVLAVQTPVEEGNGQILVDGKLKEDDRVDELKDVKYETRLIQGCRELGWSRLAELDVLVDKGADVR
eukprot:scaffold530_cov193-Alexandrium_tamarense.AAC.38